MNFPIACASALAVASLIGCATQATQDLRLGPTFTEEQKELMTDDEKLAIYNAQVSDENKLECSYEQVVGSHRPQKICMTAEEREWNRESAREALRGVREVPVCLATVCPTGR